MANIPIWLTARLTPRLKIPFFNSISKGEFSCLVPFGTCKDSGLCSSVWFTGTSTDTCFVSRGLVRDVSDAESCSASASTLEV